MKIIVFSIIGTDFVAVNDKSYFLNGDDYSTHLLPTTCPHRGGPLHLGEVNPDGNSITCPWHDNVYKVCNLESKSPPTVKIGSTINLIVGSADRCGLLRKPSRYNSGT
jgi:nitrite reductase (NADH) small subunit